MGIPAAFRWLSNKYPKIISPVMEDRPKTMDDGITIPVDTTRPNPNGEELDNLYLDMNGIVHPCSHPEDKPAPEDEEEMMLEVFKYTDRVVNMVRPRKILMIAVDGVAPRAKMNQQRSRRFRSAQEASDKEADRLELLKLLKQQNGGTHPAENSESIAKKAFDSNSITPGTPFMDTLAISLRYWCQYKLNTDPGWAKLKVIISDATVPGEGEHKIMSFVRSQRASADYDPNTRHVIYGLDADRIMLSLATHEPHFRVLREDVFFQEAKTRACKLCGQKGHEAANCRGEAAPDKDEANGKNNDEVLKPFIWLHVSVLREYLAAELAVAGLPFRFDLERAIDDWIFMCCFVGNDFLPHLPALEIREHGIDTLMTLWRDNLPSMGGYVTKDGQIDMERAQCILDGLAKQENAIFKRRKEQEDRREANNKRRRLQNDNGTRDGRPNAAGPSSALTHDLVVNRSSVQDSTLANKSAASALKEQLRVGTHAPNSKDTAHQSPPPALGKRKASDLEEDAKKPTTSKAAGGPPDGAVVDNVRLWEDGFADRYYQQKFNRDPQDIEFRHQVAQAYVEGLAWVLSYYFQGCQSWEWYYPYHYAPFAADFKDLPSMQISFEQGRISRPFEQLMSVLPAASRQAIPKVFHDLMTNPDSEIIDFYPEDFAIDLNGKKWAWQGVALLPFIDMPRLLAAVEGKYPLLSPEDTVRNGRGHDVLILSDNHAGLYDEVLTNFYSKRQGESRFKLNPKTSDGLSGKVEKKDDYVPHGALHYPLERRTMPDLEYDHSVSVHYDMPAFSHPHKSMLLRGARLPPPALTQSDIEVVKGQARRVGRNHGGAPLTRFNQVSGRHEPINYGPRDGQNARPGYGGRGYHNPDQYAAPHAGPPSSWHPPPPGAPGFGMGIAHPPPPGAPGFGMGMPPPPPLAYHQNGRAHNAYGPEHGPGYGHVAPNGWLPQEPNSSGSWSNYGSHGPPRNGNHFQDRHGNR